MRVNGQVHYTVGSKSYKFQIPVEDEFPASTPTTGEFWFLSYTNTESREPGLYFYDVVEADWVLITNELTNPIIQGDNESTLFTFNILRSSDSVKVLNVTTEEAALKAYVPKVQLTTTSSININTTSEIDIPWQTQLIIDSDFFSHSTSTNNDEVTVLKAGVVRVDFHVNYTVSGGGFFGSSTNIEGYIKKNNTKLDEAVAYGGAWTSGFSDSMIQKTVYVPVAVNDVLKLSVIREQNTSTSTLIPGETILSMAFYETL